MLLTLIVINPKKNVKEELFYKNIVLVALDKTLSMSETKKTEEVELINKYIESTILTYDKFIKKEVLLENSDIEEKDSGTNFFSTLKKELNKINKDRVAGIIFVTDGQIHDIEEYSDKLDNIPIHFIIVGKENELDRVLKTYNVPDYSIVGEQVNFDLIVEDYYTKKDLVADIILDGKKYLSKKIKPNKNYQISIPIYHAGENVLEIKVKKLPGEISEINNYKIHKIKGVHEKLRVMLISGEPNMGLRSLRNLLNSDPSIELVHFTILRPPSKRDLTPVKELSLIPFPTDELFAADISKFSLIIFDQYSLQGVLPKKYLSNITNFVLKGGALLDIAGPEYAKQTSIINSPLKIILPTNPLDELGVEEFKPELTELGLRHPITNKLITNYKNKPWGSWNRFIKTEKKSGKILLKHKNYPILVASQVGDGRVVQLLSDQTWIWKKSITESGPLTELVRNTIHWLLKTPELEENFLNFTKNSNIINVTLNTLLPGNANAKITSPSNKTINFLMKDNNSGGLNGQFISNELGKHKLEVKGITKYIYLGQKNNKELEDIKSTENKVNILSKTKNNISTHWYESGMPKILIIYNDKILSGQNWIGIKNKNVPKTSQFISKEYLDWYFLLPFLLGLFIYSWFRESRD